MRPLSKKVITAETGSKNSDPVETQNVVSCSAQAIATGTYAGDVKLQFSNDPIGSTPTNWSDITNATVTLTGSAGVFAIQKTDICCNFIRVVATKSGGTGTITVNYNSYGF